MRGWWIVILTGLPCLGALSASFAGADAPIGDEQILAAAHVPFDSAALLDLFQKRVPSDSDRTAAQALIPLLGADSFRERERATRALIELGPKANGVLRTAVKSSDPEIALRAESCLHEIRDHDVSAPILQIAIKVLMERGDSDAVETLFNYLPIAEFDGVAEEVQQLLTKRAVEGGKANAALVAGMKDKNPLRRAPAAGALCRAGAVQYKDDYRKLLEDPAATVRLRVALALINVQDRDAIPVLIDTIPTLPADQAWRAEDVLLRLAKDNAPDIAMDPNPASRDKYHAAWKSWWQNHGDDVDADRLKKSSETGDRTIIVLLDENRIVELNRKNQPRWEIANLSKPLDVQLLPNERLLITEYDSGHLSERNFKGDILWEKWIEKPQAAQRLPNGNLFVVTDRKIVEFDRADTPVMQIVTPTETVMKASKLGDGNVACLTTRDRVVIFDSKGAEVSEYPVMMEKHLLGGRLQALPDNHLLIPLNAEDKVVELDAQGKMTWQVDVIEPIVATRLPSGNTLVTTMLPETGVVEFNSRGERVWSYKTETRVTRALRH